MKSTVILLIAILFLVSCQSKLEKMQGHWHSIDSLNSGFYRTIDIKDSIGIINSNAVVGIEYDEFELFDLESNLQILFYGSNTRALKKEFTIEENKIYDEDNQLKYLKYDSSECKKKDFFAEIMIDITLNSCSSNSRKLDSRWKINNTFLSHVSVGKIKFYGKDELNNFGIQVNGALIKPSEVPLFINGEKDKLETSDNAAFCLNIDKATPQHFIDSVYTHLIPKLGRSDLYHSCYNPKTREVEYVKINVDDLNY